MKHISLLLLIFLFSISLFAQKEYIKKNKTYSLARVYSKDHNILKVHGLELINDSILVYNTVGAAGKTQVAVKDLKYVSVKKGSHALTYGLIGAGIGLFSVGITHIAYSADPLLDDYNWTGMYVGFTVGCGAIGAIIGAFIYKWKRLYFQDKAITSLMVYPNIQRKSYRLGLVITF